MWIEHYSLYYLNYIYSSIEVDRRPTNAIRLKRLWNKVSFLKYVPLTSEKLAYYSLNINQGS